MSDAIPRSVRREVLDRLRTADRILAAAAKSLEAGDPFDEAYSSPTESEGHYADAEVGQAHQEFRQAAELLGATQTDNWAGLRRYGSATLPELTEPRGLMRFAPQTHTLNEIDAMHAELHKVVEALRSEDPELAKTVDPLPRWGSIMPVGGAARGSGIRPWHWLVAGVIAVLAIVAWTTGAW